jgi:hypothetical protein
MRKRQVHIPCLFSGNGHSCDVQIVVDCVPAGIERNFRKAPDPSRTSSFEQDAITRRAFQQEGEVVFASPHFSDKMLLFNRQCQRQVPAPEAEQVGDIRVQLQKRRCQPRAEKIDFRVWMTLVKQAEQWRNH